MEKEQMTDNERAGIDWWNALPKDIREFWLVNAANASSTPRTITVADAWAHYKRVTNKTSP